MLLRSVHSRRAAAAAAVICNMTVDVSAATNELPAPSGP